MAAYQQAQGASIANVGKTMFNYMQATNYAKYAAQAAKFRAIQSGNTQT